MYLSADLSATAPINDDQVSPHIPASRVPRALGLGKPHIRDARPVWT